MRLAHKTLSASPSGETGIGRQARDRRSTIFAYPVRPILNKADTREASMIAELKTIRDDLAAKRPIQPVTVRTFLSWFEAQRRGYWIVEKINKQLREAGIKTFPEFESAWIDAPIEFSLDEVEKEPVSRTPEAPVESVAAELPTSPDVTSWVSKDPTYRVSKLQAANQKIVSVNPDGTISEVVTLLMAGGFSQLPVMTNEREVKGIITWRSIGSRMALSSSGGSARHFMEPHQEIRSDTSIFGAIPLIVASGYVLVRGNDNKISGIITASDLSIQFRT
jgi:predicted transcriptional regulator